MFLVFFIKYPLTPLDIPTPEINKVIRPTKEMNRVVLSMKLLKLLVLFFTVFMEMFVPSINLFKEDKSIFLLFGINLILYFIREPGITRPVFFKV